MSGHQPPALAGNLLRKVGSNLRLYLERCGVDPEGTKVVVVVPDEVSKSRMISGFLADFDGATMSRRDDRPEAVAVLDLPIHVGVMETA